MLEDTLEHDLECACERGTGGETVRRCCRRTHEQLERKGTMDAGVTRERESEDHATIATGSHTRVRGVECIALLVKMVLYVGSAIRGHDLSEAPKKGTRDNYEKRMYYTSAAIQDCSDHAIHFTQKSSIGMTVCRRHEWRHTSPSRRKLLGNVVLSDFIQRFSVRQHPQTMFYVQ